LGYVEGRDFVMEYRWAEGHPDRFPGLAADLVRAHVDIIVANGTAAALAAKQATQTIPIVFAVGNAVEKGIVVSLAHPGANLTGLSLQGVDVSHKLFQLFKEAVPTLVRMVYLYDPSIKTPGMEERLQSHAQEFKLEIQLVALRDATGVAHAFAEFKPGTNGLMLEPSAAAVLAAHQICEFALQRRLPTTVPLNSMFPRIGCLMSYGEHQASNNRHLAVVVEKILK